MSRKSQKTNPNKILCTEADVRRVCKKTFDDTTDYILTMMAWCLVDDMGVSDEFLHILSRRFASINESIVSGNLRLAEVKQALKDEHDWEVETTVHIREGAKC